MLGGLGNEAGPSWGGRWLSIGVRSEYWVDLASHLSMQMASSWK